MGFMVHFTMGTGGHYITMLPADWSISTSHDPLPSSYHSEKMLWNPSIPQYQRCHHALLYAGRNQYCPWSMHIQGAVKHITWNIMSIVTAPLNLSLGSYRLIFQEICMWPHHHSISCKVN